MSRVNYSGARNGDEIRLVGSDENHAVYTLMAHRIAPVASLSPSAPSAPQTAPARVALLNPPTPPVPEPGPSPEISTLCCRSTATIAAATGARQRHGEWIVSTVLGRPEQTTSSAPSFTANLVFTGNRGTMHVGADDWPLFDVRDSGGDVAFSLVIPGTPYRTVRYAGTVAGDTLQLARP